MSKYLVTGCAGFIASKVSEMLLAEGHEVVGIDNLNDAYDVRLKHWRLDRLLPHPNFTFYKVDISERKALNETVGGNQGFDAIFNLAARAGVRQSVENPWVYYETNAIGTLNLLELAKDNRIPKFILASTSSLYGDKNPMPFSEDADTNHPLSPYAASKKAAETLCYTYHHLYGIDCTVFRYFTVYGPAGRPDMSLFRFVQWIAEGRPVIIFGDGRQSRDFTYVDDIGRGTLLGRRMGGYELVNLGSNSPELLSDAVALIESALGCKGVIDYQRIQTSDIRATWANISKATALFGWHPNVSFSNGIQHLVDWYCQNRAWASEINCL